MIRNEGRHIAFGRGDIGIHMGVTSDVVMLMLRNLEKPFPVGKLVNGREPREVELLDTDVVMSFSNAESIDTFVKCLKIIRRKLSKSASRINQEGQNHE